MPLSTNSQKLKSLTLNPEKLTSSQIEKINHSIKSVVDKKTDEYWKNYQNFDIKKQTAISLVLDESNLVAFSSILNKPFYGKGVFRMMNRWLINEDYREEGASKTYGGNHRFFEMIHQQYLYINQLKPKFVFISRQRKNTKWLNWYFDRFNKTYGTDFIVSKNQYRICDGSDYDCCQTLIYPKEMKIPFEKLV